MKLLLLKILLQRRNRDEGFTLPMVIAIGLIMILLGAVNILSAGEEDLLAISDNQKNKALAIAEVGVARYRQLLDKNRMLTVYSNNQWSSLTNTCDISSTVNNFADSTDWKQVNNGTENIGQYRIVSYIYDIDNSRDADKNLLSDNNNQFAPNSDEADTTDFYTFNDTPYNPATGDGYNPKGVLTVKSEATDGSVAQVEVEIPVRINRNDMTNLSPALWIGDRTVTRPGTLTINDGNIVLSQPATGTTAGCTVPANVSGITPISDPRPLPNIISEPAASLINSENITPVPNNLANLDPRYDEFRGENNQLENMLLLGAKEASTASPQLHKKWKTDAEGFDYFFYKAPSGITLNNTKLATDGQSRVILYVEGDINLTNNASLQAGSKFTREYKSVGLQVYVNGSQNINIDPGGGTVRIKGLIHAPESTVNITGSGNVEIEGAMWVKNWNNTGSANVKITADNAGVGSDKAYLHYLGTDNRAAKPITGAPTDWEVQEAAAN